MEEDLEHWRWIVDQRTEDLNLEIERDEDDVLIRLLMEEKEMAQQKVEELNNAKIKHIKFRLYNTQFHKNQQYLELNYE